MFQFLKSTSKTTKQSSNQFQIQANFLIILFIFKNYNFQITSESRCMKMRTRKTCWDLLKNCAMRNTAVSYLLVFFVLKCLQRNYKSFPWDQFFGKGEINQTKNIIIKSWLSWYLNVIFDFSWDKGSAGDFKIRPFFKIWGFENLINEIFMKFARSGPSHLYLPIHSKVIRYYIVSKSAKCEKISLLMLRP